MQYIHWQTAVPMSTRQLDVYKRQAYTISFRAKDRTLEDKDIQPIMEKILGDLSGMGIELRS